MELDFKIDVSCVVWFSAPTDLSCFLGSELKIKKYHEVVNSAIMNINVKPFSVKRTLEVVHVEESYNAYKKKEPTKKCTPSSFSDGDDEEEQSFNE